MSSPEAVAGELLRPEAASLNVAQSAVENDGGNIAGSEKSDLSIISATSKALEDKLADLNGAVESLQSSFLSATNHSPAIVEEEDPSSPGGGGGSGSPLARVQALISQRASAKRQQPQHHQLSQSPTSASQHQSDDDAERKRLQGQLKSVQAILRDCQRQLEQKTAEAARLMRSEHEAGQLRSRCAQLQRQFTEASERAAERDQLAQMTESLEAALMPLKERADAARAEAAECRVRLAEREAEAAELRQLADLRAGNVVKVELELTELRGFLEVAEKRASRLEALACQREAELASLGDQLAAEIRSKQSLMKQEETARTEWEQLLAARDAQLAGLSECANRDAAEATRRLGQLEEDCEKCLLARKEVEEALRDRVAEVAELRESLSQIGDSGKEILAVKEALVAELSADLARESDLRHRETAELNEQIAALNESLSSSQAQVDNVGDKELIASKDAEIVELRESLQRQAAAWQEEAVKFSDRVASLEKEYLSQRANADGERQLAEKEAEVSRLSASIADERLNWQEEAASLLGRIASLQESLSESKKTDKDLIAAKNAEVSSLTDSLNRESSLRHQETDELRRQIASMHESLLQASQREKALVADKDAEMARLVEGLHQESALKSRETADLQSRLATMEESLSEQMSTKEAELSSLRQQLSVREASLAETLRLLEARESQILDLVRRETEAAANSEPVDGDRRDPDEAAAEIEELLTNLTETKRQLAIREDQILALKAENFNASTAAQEIRVQYQTLVQNYTVAYQQNGQLRQRMSQLEARLQEQSGLSEAVERAELMAAELTELKAVLRAWEGEREAQRTQQQQRSVEVASLQAEIGELRQELQKRPTAAAEAGGDEANSATCERLRQEVDRLRRHLMEVEESYTAELLQAEAAQQEMRARLAQLEATAGSSDSTGQQVHTLQMYLDAVRAERDRALGLVKSQARELEESRRSQSNLEMVLAKFKDGRSMSTTAVAAAGTSAGGRSSDIVDGLARSYRDRALRAESERDNLASELADCRARLAEAAEAVAAAGRLAEAADSRDGDLARLRADAEAARAAAVAAKEEVAAARAAGVDRSLVRSLVLACLHAPPAKRAEALDVMAHCVGLTDAEVKGGGAASPLSPSSSAAAVTKKSFSEEFVKFLQRESAPKKVLPLPLPADAPPTGVSSPSSYSRSRAPSGTYGGGLAPHAVPIQLNLSLP